MATPPPPPRHIGTAGWNIPAPHAALFTADGSHLERYARFFTAVEINSSFYRSHRPATYRRWAATVPDAFRFAVKIPRDITHARRLVEVEAPLLRFLEETAELGDKRGPLLLQLPPSLSFRPDTAADFLAMLRSHFNGQLVCEPRHRSWFSTEASQLLIRHHIARVAADPAPVPGAEKPGAWDGLRYYRLHGSPRVYYSAYPASFIAETANLLRTAEMESWCIFDNTAEGAATADAAHLSRRLGLIPALQGPLMRQD